MTFNEWKKMNKIQQEKITATWDAENDEGKSIAEAALKAFTKEFEKNKKIKILPSLGRIEGRGGWAISVQCFSDSVCEKIPENYLGINVRRYIFDEDSKNHPIFQKIENAKKKRN